MLGVTAAAVRKRAARGVANKRKAARQDAAIGQCRQQLAAALGSRPAHGDEVPKRALRTLGIAHDAFTPALDTAAQQMLAQPAGAAAKIASGGC